MDKRPSRLCQSPLLSVRLRRLRSRSVTAQSGPCRRASVTSRRPICKEGMVLSGEKKSSSVLSLCRRISFRRMVSMTQLPSALRRAEPVSEPRAISAPMVFSTTSLPFSWPWISTLVAGTPFRVSEPALIWICAFLPSTLPASGCHGLTPPVTFCALKSHSVLGLLKAMLFNCRRSAWKGIGAVCGERFSVPSTRVMVSICSGSVSCRLPRPISTFLATSVAG
ncbi:Uncharacterised protein [Enterobacter cloacae]|nr:Uncharacterised protein [Enterobacter cloacae]